MKNRHSAGWRTLKVTGDKVKLLVQVGTSIGCITATHEFLISDDDTEDMVMGVAWHKSIVGIRRRHQDR
jgi:hypothetical protein